MRSELINDYKVLDEYPDMKTKKALATKYGIESKKATEIQKMVLIAMRNERKTRTTFDSDDIKYFYRFDIPETYNKAVSYYEEESIEFIKFLVEYNYDFVCKKNLQNKLEYANSRNSYYVSIADKYVMKRYLNVKRFVDENEPVNIDKREIENKILETIKTRLLADMKPFHDAYIERVEKWATKNYENLPKQIEDAKFKVDHMDPKINKSVSYKQYENIKNAYNKLIAIIKMFPTIEEYVAYQIKNAENGYNNDINSLTERIKTKKMNHENISVTNIYNDPKFFEMTITDGNVTMHARSVWAAEYSTKVTAHYRFIIT